MEKEMENKAKDKITPVWIVSQKLTSLQLRYLEIIAKWAEKTEQFPQKTAEEVNWYQMAPQKNKHEPLPSHRNRATINNNNWKKMETTRAYTKTTSRLSSKERHEILPSRKN